MDRAVAAGDVRIQVERTEDRDAVAAVVAAAFGSRAEADLVEAIRSSPEYIAELSLVAEGDGGIVGHVMVSHAELHRGDVRHLIFSLAPLAVTPSRQGQGIGSALVKAVTDAARKMGAAFVVLQGPTLLRTTWFRALRSPGDRHGASAVGAA